MKWRILTNGKLSPAENMAIDDAVFQLIQQGKSLPLIRFYDWEPASLSLGYNQCAKKEVDFDVLNEKGYGFVRRPTGGRLVLHKDEITYAVIAPTSDKLSGNVLQSYGKISTALAEGLKKMGLNVEFEQKTLTSFSQREAVNPCFNSSSKYELAVEGKKIVGSAQARANDVLLQHGSIIFQENQSEIAQLMPNLNNNLRKRLADMMNRKTVSINQVLSTPIDYNSAVNCLIKGFMQAWDNDEFTIINSLEAFEQELVEKLIKNKYSTDEWNFKK